MFKVTINTVSTESANKADAWAAYENAVQAGQIACLAEDGMILASFSGNRKTWTDKVPSYEEWRDHSKDNMTYLKKRAIIDPILDKVAHGEKLTCADYYALVGCINVSVLTGKLEGYSALSTSVLMNPFCRKRASCGNSKCICTHCYAASGVQRYGNTLGQSLECNTMILNGVEIPEEVWAVLAIPTTNGEARIEAHGDTASVTCAVNYNRIMKSHDSLDFGDWSKNLGHYYVAFDREGKAKNCSFVASSPMVNRRMTIAQRYRWFVDHRFTVYEREYALAHKININCGQYTETLEKIDQRCKNCARPCYHLGGVFDIAEILK